MARAPARYIQKIKRKWGENGSTRARSRRVLLYTANWADLIPMSSEKIFETL